MDGIGGDDGEWVDGYGTWEVTVKGPNLIRELGKGGIVVVCWPLRFYGDCIVEVGSRRQRNATQLSICRRQHCTRDVMRITDQDETIGQLNRSDHLRKYRKNDEESHFVIVGFDCSVI